MTYEDLLLVPYKENGRTAAGMDCYGLVLECCRRSGQHLKDIVYESVHVQKKDMMTYTAALNVVRTEKPIRYGIVQCDYNNELHIGFLLDQKTVLHATRQGVRVSPVCSFKNCSFFEVISA